MEILTLVNSSSHIVQIPPSPPIPHPHVCQIGEVQFRGVKKLTLLTRLDPRKTNNNLEYRAPYGIYKTRLDLQGKVARSAYCVGKYRCDATLRKIGADLSDY